MIHPGAPAYPDAMALVALTGERWAEDAALYVRGRLPARRGVSVVGSRKATKRAVDFTQAVARALVEAGFAVWSGGALGIDTAAHLGALHADGATVAVLGGGHDHPFPRDNAALFDLISDRGATIALVPDDVRAARWRFLHRNVVLAALTDATVVIQANRRPSGAIHAATAARRLGRPVLCPPDAPWSEPGAGNLTLLEEGAIPFHSIEALIDRLGRLRAPWASPIAPSPHARATPATAPELALDPSDRALLAALGDTPEHVDALCERLARPYLELNASLVSLVLAGAVDEPSPGFYRRRDQKSSTLGSLPSSSSSSSPKL